VLTVLSPIVMTYFLAFATGAKLLERHLAQRPGYAAYQRRTSSFLPRPPRHR
jgi:steroid 5-alpha reductase family enzyme